MESKKPLNQSEVGEAIRNACQLQFGVIDKGFLCRSLGSLNLKDPICVNEVDSLESVVRTLQSNRIGTVLVTNTSGVLTGILSERDCVLKVMLSGLDLKQTPVSQIMTREPVTQPPTGTVAYALNLMSNGGFRHLPIVDDQNHPISVLSVKDIVDFIVERMTEDLLGFETT